MEDEDYEVTGTAWDCDPNARVTLDPYDEGLDEEDSTSDWQTLVLDRFGDRLVIDRMFKPRSKPMFGM